MKQRNTVFGILTLIFLWHSPDVLCGDDTNTWWMKKPAHGPVAIDKEAGQFNAIDHFIDSKLAEVKLLRSPQAEPGELIRRVFYDVIGLPPNLDDIEAFKLDPSDQAYENLVDRLLSDVGYGEKWAGHWLDLVHFAETHGHDEDAIREHAWHYRDYVISALNEDRPYSRFVEDQVAGDILYPEDRWSWMGVGFLAAGPWDSSSQQGIQDGTVDKHIAQMMDRDDMITNTMSTFTSLTVHCARCHDHKFDPISQEDYFALQAVFAGVDRANRSLDANPGIRQKRRILESAQNQLGNDRWPVEFLTPSEARSLFQEWLENIQNSESHWTRLEKENLTTTLGSQANHLADGSWILNQDAAPEKDSYSILGNSPVDTIAAIRLELLPDPSLPQMGPGRQANGNLHLSEIRIESIRNGVKTLHRLETEARSDFDQSGWEVNKAVDGIESTAWGIYPKVGQPHQAIFDLAEPIAGADGLAIRITLDQHHGGQHLIGRFRLSISDRPSLPVTPPLPEEISPWLTSNSLPEAENMMPALRKFLAIHINDELAQLPPQIQAYVATNQFDPAGNFKPAVEPRPVHVLKRGDIHKPGDEAVPGSLSCLNHLPARFELPSPSTEGARRAALAIWLSHPDNPLTWRSIVNRIWLQYFGRGIVATPNDFGKMGSQPTHPELLDWLAGELITNGGSLKQIHKTILMSRTYRQSSHERPDGISRDRQNQLYWRANLRLLPAEAVRDSILAVSGDLNRRVGGPSARHFIATKGVHVTPNLDYLGFDPQDPENRRRAIYRFRFRTVPDPFMKLLNCADASQLTPVRRESVTSFQALALLHNRWVIHQSSQWARNLQEQFSDLHDQISEMGARAYGRNLSQSEIDSLSGYARDNGLANACRMIFNSNEFLFIP